MTISTANFPTWFFVGFYGGLVCCVLAVLISLGTLYTAIKRREVTRRLISVVIVCIASFLCLLPAFIWFHMNTRLSLIEMVALLGYVLFFGWLLSIGTMVFYFIPSPSRLRLGAINKRDESQRQEKRSSEELHPPRYEPGVQAPLVFSAETPWGWLEYCSGNFQGQRLALKRSIMIMGRDEDCDIWLDDDMASRKHAEVAWDNSIVYLTDRNSMNGTRLNGRKIRGSVLLSSDDLLEIGEQRFRFLLTEQKTVTTEQYDPLINHKWRTSFELQESRETTRDRLPLPTTKPPLNTDQVQTQSQSLESGAVSSVLYTPPSLPTVRGMLLVRSGALAGKRFFLQSLSVTIGSDAHCDLVVQDLELAPQHARFIRQAQGDYVQDLSGLSGQAGTLVNGEAVQVVQLLRPGDRIRFGSFHLTYLSVLQDADEQEPSSQKPVSVNPSTNGGPAPLRLPSRQKGM